MLCMLMHLLHGNHDAQAQAPHSNEPLLDVLKRRYAQGEINQAQFEETMRVLGLATSAQVGSQPFPQTQPSPSGQPAEKSL